MWGPIPDRKGIEMTRSFFDEPEAQFAAGSQVFLQGLEGTPPPFNVPGSLVTQYEFLNSTLQELVADCGNPSLRTPTKVAQKRAAKKACRAAAVAIAAIVRAFPGTTDAQLVALSLAPRGPRQARRVPGKAALRIASVSGRTVVGRLSDPSDPTRRGLPPEVDGATVVSYTGSEPPSDVEAWSFVANVSRASFKTTFPATVAPGSKVWLAAFFFNERKQSGEASDPVSTYLGASLSQAA